MQNTLSNISFEGEEVRYIYTVPLGGGEEVVSSISVQMNENGDTEFHVTEGQIYNELIFTANGEVLLDGNEVRAASGGENSLRGLDVGSEMQVQPRLGSVYYSKDPFWGNYRDYNESNGEREGDIVFDAAITSCSLTTISGLIGIFVPGVGTILTLVSIAESIRYAYSSYNSKGKTLFYIKETWDNPKAPPVSETMTTYHKQRTKWYTDSLYKNEVTDSRETFYVKTVIRDV